MISPTHAAQHRLLQLPAVRDNAAMQTEPPKADPPKRQRRWFQFSLRTLFVVVTAWAVLLAQWPLVDYAPEKFTSVAIQGKHDEWRIDVTEEHHVVPMRVIVVASAEAAALIGWLIWRRLRRAATQS